MPVHLQSLNDLYVRELIRLEEEIKEYIHDADVWKILPGTSNSGGNLCLHLCGNLRYFFGAVLGGDGYVRDRDAEFSLKGLSREDLLKIINETRSSVQNTIKTLSEDIMAKEYPLVILGKPHTTEFFLMHLLSHLSYHLGQLNYHRRMVS